MPIFWFQVLPFVVLLIFGVCIGTIVERAHFRRLARRERELAHMLATNTRPTAKDNAGVSHGLVVGEVVVASDYFKTFMASIRKVFGGELRSFETLMERARREAVLRMMESARDLGANRVVNVRLATSSIGSVRRRSHAAMVEMYAYGTAMFVPED